VPFFDIMSVEVCAHMNALMLPPRKDEDQSFSVLRLLEALKNVDPVVRPTVERIIIEEHKLSIGKRWAWDELARKQHWTRFLVNTAIATAVVLFTTMLGVAQAITVIQQHLTWK
jgi:hypothetical protein